MIAVDALALMHTDSDHLTNGDQQGTNGFTPPPDRIPAARPREGRPPHLDRAANADERPAHPPFPRRRQTPPRGTIGVRLDDLALAAADRPLVRYQGGLVSLIGVITGHGPGRARVRFPSGRLRTVRIDDLDLSSIAPDRSTKLSSPDNPRSHR